MGLTVIKNYKYSGFSTATNYRGVAVRGSRIAIVGNSNKYFYSNAATATTVSMTSVTTPASASISTIGDALYINTTTLFFTNLDMDTNGTGDASASIYITSDHSAFARHRQRYAYGVNVSPPATSDCSCTLPKCTMFSTTGEVFVIPSAVCVNPFPTALNYVTLNIFVDSGLDNAADIFGAGSVLAIENSNNDNLTSNRVRFIGVNGNLFEVDDAGSLTNKSGSATSICQYGTVTYVAGNNGYLKTYGTATTATAVDVSFTTTISVTDMAVDTSGNILIIGKSGKMIYWENTTTQTSLSDTGSRDLNAVEYDSARGVFVVAGNGIVFDVEVIGEESLPAQFLARGIGSATLAAQFYVAQDGSATLASQFLAKEVTSASLPSQFKAIQTIVITPTLPCQLLVANVPGDTFSISFADINFSDNGIRTQSWKDLFDKDIETQIDNTKHGFSMNRFAYFGMNRISMSGVIITSTISTILNLTRNKTSYGYARLYKRPNFYTDAQLRNFDVQESKNGRFYEFKAEFWAERPYYYLDSPNTYSATVAFAGTVTPHLQANILEMINDDSEITFEGSIPSGTYCVTAGYKLTGKTNDTSPLTSVMTVSELATITYLDQNNNSIGATFPRRTFIKRMYLGSYDLTTTYPYDVQNDFSIYFRNENNNWELYDQPVNVYIDNIPGFGNMIIFDELYVSTYEIKVRYNNADTRNVIQYASVNDRMKSLIIPEFYSRMYINQFGVSNELRIDVKQGRVYADGVEHLVEGQLLRIYPKTCYFWILRNGTSVKLIYKFNTIYFPV